MTQNADYERVVVVAVDDWHGVYLDGVLLHEGHEIPSFAWIDVLLRAGIGVTDLTYKPESEALVEAGAGRYPAHIDGSGSVMEES